MCSSGGAVLALDASDTLLSTCHMIHLPPCWAPAGGPGGDQALRVASLSAAARRWQDASKYYGRAAELAPAFSFAAANKALALYQMGEEEPAHTEQAVREMRRALLWHGCRQA